MHPKPMFDLADQPVDVLVLRILGEEQTNLSEELAFLLHSGC